MQLPNGLQLAGRRRDRRGDQLNAVAEVFGCTKQSAFLFCHLAEVLRQGREFAEQFIIGSSTAGLSTMLLTASADRLLSLLCLLSTLLSRTTRKPLHGQASADSPSPSLEVVFVPFVHFAALNVLTWGSSNSAAIEANVRITTIGSQSLGFVREGHTQQFKVLHIIMAAVRKRCLVFFSEVEDRSKLTERLGGCGSFLLEVAASLKIGFTVGLSLENLCSDASAEEFQKVSNGRQNPSRLPSLLFSFVLFL